MMVVFRRNFYYFSTNSDRRSFLAATLVACKVIGLAMFGLPVELQSILTILA